MIKQWLQQLKDWKCDVSGALERMLDDQTMYGELTEEAMRSPLFAQLGAHLASGQVKAAFDDAHTLKGMLLTLGLNALAKPSVDLCELLRAGRTDGSDALYAALMQMRADWAQALDIQLDAKRD